MDWQPISTAPVERDLQLAVIDHDGPHALIFPCRRTPAGWVNVQTKRLIDVRPTHWREWQDNLAARPLEDRQHVIEPHHHLF